MNRFLIAASLLALAGCSDLTPEQDQFRQQGRPFLVGQSEGLKAYRWDIPLRNSSQTLYFIVGQATTTCVSPSDPTTCDTVDASAVNSGAGQRGTLTEAAFQAMSKLTPEERVALGVTR